MLRSPCCPCALIWHRPGTGLALTWRCSVTVLCLFCGTVLWQLSGTAERPRLRCSVSNKHIYAQVIDDGQMHTPRPPPLMSPALREELSLSAGPTVVSWSQILCYILLAWTGECCAELTVVSRS